MGNIVMMKSMVIGSLLYLSSCSYLEYHVSIEQPIQVNEICTPKGESPIRIPSNSEPYTLPPPPDIDSLNPGDVQGEVIMLLDYIDLLRNELIEVHK